MNNLPRSDRELFAAVKLNDKHAFNRLYEKYWPLIFKNAFFYLQDHESVMEIVNDIFLNIWLKRKELNIISFESYLRAASRYRVYNFLKANKSARLVYVENYQQIDYLGFIANGGETKVKDKELNDMLVSLVSPLPKRCREIFMLSRVAHLSNDEIAEKLHVSKRTVQNQITLALKYLKLRLANPT